jgi:hypothetical protein
MRVTSAEVIAVMGGTNTLDATVIDALIVDASAWVTAHVTGSEATLTSIEKYLTAHLATLTAEGTDGQLVASQRGDVSERYAERKGDTNGATSYIRIAASFDRTGVVAEYWLGKRRVLFKVGTGYADE